MLVTAFLAALTVSLTLGATLNDDPAWNEYKIEFGKVYSTEQEEQFRYNIWKQNEQEVNLHNAMFSQSYTQGLNSFSDMTDEEFKNIYDCSSNETESEREEEKDWFEPEEDTNEETVNWAEKGAVTGIKNQGHCGSCYSFGATGALEGQWFRKTKQLVSLSEQQIVDCSYKWGNRGCHGGMAYRAWKYIQSAGGSVSEKAYPYKAVQGHCHTEYLKQVVAKVAGYKRVRPFDEVALKAASAQIGPIAVSIDAGHHSFRRYKSGVYNEPRCSRTRHNHAVLLVGYGRENGQDYWLIKNSWGTKWGMKGFGKMSRNKNSQCAIASNPMYPTV